MYENTIHLRNSVFNSCTTLSLHRVQRQPMSCMEGPEPPTYHCDPKPRPMMWSQVQRTENSSHQHKCLITAHYLKLRKAYGTHPG